MSEPDIVKTLFDKLLLAPIQRFPRDGEKLDAPKQPGIYVLYGPRNKVIYVGLAAGANGLRSRLMTHLVQSAFHESKYGSALRSRGGFRCLIVENRRQRKLLEAYATGCLCPTYLGGIEWLP